MPLQRPARWQPPPTRPGTPVALPVSLVELPGTGAEDVLIDHAGSVVTGLSNGDVVRVSAQGAVVLGNTGGRPLGIEEYPDGNLLVCDHDRGLLRLDVTTGDAETIRYRILKLWLKGPRAGEWVEFASGLPGFPDNISLSRSELVWVTLPAPRVPVLDFLLPRHPILRQLALRVPEWLHPKEADVVWVQAYDLDGRLVHDIKTKHPRLSYVTAAAESGGTVWLASVHHNVLGRIDLGQGSGGDPQDSLAD